MKTQVLILFAIVFTALGEVDIEKCIKAAKSKPLCCQAEMRNKEDYESLKECFDGDHAGCEREICIGKKKGFISSNGDFDYDALLALVEDKFKDNTETLEAIKEKCLAEELKEFMKQDQCNLKHLFMCFHVMIMAHCTPWNDSAECSEIKSTVQTCSSGKLI